MNILISGGTGFIGQTLCPTLLAAGHSLTVLSRTPGKVEKLFGNQIAPIHTLQALSDSDHFDAVINLAGAPIFGGRWTKKRKQILRHSRIGITQGLVDFIARAERKPSAFLSGSAIGFYGDQGDTIVDETSPGHDEFGHRLCDEWEKEAEKAKLYGVRVCLLRTGLVIGKNGGFLQPMLLPFKLGFGGRLGSGEQWMSWIHIDDHVAICQTLLEDSSLAGKFNLTAPNPVTNQVFVKTLAGLLNRPALLPAPAWALKLILGEMSELLIGSQRVIPKRILETGFQYKFAVLDDALKDVLKSRDKR